MSLRLCGQIMALSLLQAGTAACTRASRSDHATQAVDSAEAVRIAVKALRLATGTGSDLSVLSFKRDSDAVLVGLTEGGPPHVGGGGLVRLSAAGKVLRVELWQ